MKYKEGDIVEIVQDPKRPSMWGHRFGENAEILEDLSYAVLIKLPSNGNTLKVPPTNIRPLTKLAKALK